MKSFLFLLTIAAFLQSSFVGVNLCLILLVARGFVVDDQANFYMGFYAGILLGILTTQNTGLLALSFLLIIKVMNILKSLPISTNSLTILPYSFVVFFIFALIYSFIDNQTLNLSLIIIETVLVLPIYFLIKVWEENFNFRKEIKLKY